MPYDITLHQPATIAIIGNTGSGKTTLLSKLCRWKNLLFDNPPKYVVLCYSQPQNIYEEMYNEGIIDKMMLGYPTYEEVETLLKPHKQEGSLIIYDDGLNAVNEDLKKIFFQLSHHFNATIVFISQTMFYGNDHFRTISINTQCKYTHNSCGLII